MSIPVTVLTGFLGSGKTTVLNRLLRAPAMEGTVVIINEFGEIGLDHLLVERSDEHLTLLNNGCLCCTVRGDLVAAMRDLSARRSRGEIAAYRRIVIETTGLADPAPVLHTLMADPAIVSEHRLEGVVTTVDAVNGLATLQRHMEAERQVAVADRILLTKTDLADGAPVRARLRGLCGDTPMLDVVNGGADPAGLIDLGVWHPDGRTMDVPAWLNAATGHDHPGHHHDVNRHDSRIRAHCLVLDEPVEWAAFEYWLELMAAMRGEAMLRIKGIVAIAGDPERPMVIHGVQHVFHPPVRLDAWPSDDRRTRLVLIACDIEPGLIERTLRKFAGVAGPVALGR